MLRGLHRAILSFQEETGKGQALAGRVSVNQEFLGKNPNYWAGKDLWAKPLKALELKTLEQRAD